MSRNSRARSVLYAASLAAIAGMGYISAAADDQQGGGGDDKGKPQDQQPKKLELTEEELQQRIDAAQQSERDKAAKDRQREKEEADRKKAEEQGEFQKIAQQEESKRTAAEQRAADAERRAQLAEVNISLRDHLAGDDARRGYLANAPDIMLHVKEKLAADAKPADVLKLIEAEAAAFISRTGPVKAASGAPAGGARGKLPAGTVVPPKSNGGDRPRYMGHVARF